MSETETETKRKSPEYRLAPMSKLVLDPPLRLPDSYAAMLGTSRPKKAEKSGRLDDRKTPLAQAMVEGIPADGSWYLAAICYSQGEATALSSHISRGGYAPGVQTASGLIPNKHKRGMKREHAVLLKRGGRPDRKRG